jgi:hypothetical protein
MAAVTRFFTKLEQGPLKPYLGVDGGRLLRSDWARQMEARNAVFRKLNNVLFTGPAFKWTLSILPLYQAITGQPPVDKIDINTNMALAGTGLIWAYYALLVRPTSWGLFSVSCALLASNGYQIVRRYKYNQELKKHEAPIHDY